MWDPHNPHPHRDPHRAYIQGGGPMTGPIPPTRMATGGMNTPAGAQPGLPGFSFASPMSSLSMPPGALTQMPNVGWQVTARGQPRSDMLRQYILRNHRMKLGDENMWTPPDHSIPRGPRALY